jgi:hypothetical protein
MAKRFFRRSAALFLVFILFFVVSFNGSSAAAEDVAASYFGLIQDGHFQSALDLCTSKVFAPAPREVRAQELDDILVTLGDLVSFRLVSAHVNYSYGVDSDQTAAILYYDVWYSDYCAWEELTIIKISDGIWRIGRHRIFADVPLPESLPPRAVT